MSGLESLFHLAGLAGIEPYYWDIGGVRHETSPDTARMLLSALGLPADDAAAVTASLAALEDREWRTLLPPVAVCRRGARTGILLYLPDDLPVASLASNVVLEDGTVHADGSVLDPDPTEATRRIDDREIRRYFLYLPSNLPHGYHTLHIEGCDVTATMPLIVAPPHCYLPPALKQGRRCWGIATQLYAVKSERNWGMGDFSDLGALVDLAAQLGADVVGLNPLHALFPSTPENASPYSPSSRLFFNPLYIDVTAIPDFAESEEARQFAEAPSFAAALRTVRTGSFVDYSAVAQLKFTVLEHLYASFRLRHLSKENDIRTAAFRRFQADSGDRLHRFAAFQGLSEAFRTNDWTQWPLQYRDPASATVAAFMREHQDRIEYFEYLQWEAEAQLAAAHRHAERSGLAVGLYADLAVSIIPESADQWSEQGLYVRQAHTGAPPDPFNAHGQDWNIAPLNPLRLRATGYAHFIALLRTNMRHADALRIDHAMGLQRLFWIPRGASPSAGTYVTYPFEDLTAILALESERNRCVVVGEDLGTVAEGFRARMADIHALSSRVLCFEKNGGRFTPPSGYPDLAVASISTHDLATLKGFWSGIDLTERSRLGLYGSESERVAAEVERAQDGRALLQALADEHLLPTGINPREPETTAMTPALAMAVHAFLARSSACLFTVALDDLTGEERQINLPGTIHEYPNWRRRLSRSLKQLAGDPAVRELAAVIARERAVPASMPPEPPREQGSAA